MCYWATDPLDNPDYERFVDDFFGVHGLYPTTLTALPIKTSATYTFASAFNRCAMVACRISFPFCRSVFLIACMPSFPPRTCCAFPCASKSRCACLLRPPFPSRSARKVKAGRVVQRDSYPKNAEVDAEPGSIACVVGFLFNMVDRSLQLIAPCIASDKWPLGYVIYDRAEFNDMDELASSIDVMIADQMSLEPRASTRVRFRSNLVYRSDYYGFELSTRWRSVAFRDPIRLPGLPSYTLLGELIHQGKMTAEQISDCFASRNVATERTREYLQTLYDAGVLDDEPHDS